MTVTRTIVGLLVLIASWTVDTGTARASEETLARAKDLYASAAYDEALAVLDGLAGAVPSETRAIAEYRVFCLLALDRTDEARRRIEDMLHDNPQYAYARQLGQLQALDVVCAPGFAQHRARQLAARGMRLGDAKSCALILDRTELSE